MKGKVFLAAALFLALGTIGIISLPATANGQEGAVMTGVWYWQNVFGSGVLPSLLTFHNDGTVFCSDALAFGGIPQAYGGTYTYTPFYGVWERTGPHAYRATWLALRFYRADPATGITPATGLLAGIVRARAQFTFADDFDHIAGTIYLDVLPCSNPLACPDPLSAPASSWVLMPSGVISFHAARVSGVPY